jgi:hypothetical protein
MSEDTVANGSLIIAAINEHLGTCLGSNNDSSAKDTATEFQSDQQYILQLQLLMIP